MNIFVITEASFEYNDEYYYQGESEGGEPVKAYSTRESAEADMINLTKEWVKEHSNTWSSIAEYGSYHGEILDIPVFASRAGLDMDDVEDAFDSHNTKRINSLILNNLDAAVESLNLRVFKVSEINLSNK